MSGMIGMARIGARMSRCHCVWWHFADYGDFASAQKVFSLGSRQTVAHADCTVPNRSLKTYRFKFEFE